MVVKIDKLTAKSLGTLSFTKLTYPVSPGHLPFLSTLYSSQLAFAREVFETKRAEGAKAEANATRATKRRAILANMVSIGKWNWNVVIDANHSASNSKFIGKSNDMTQGKMPQLLEILGCCCS